MLLGDETPGSPAAGCNSPDENRNHFVFQDIPVYDILEDPSVAAE
jgi:hypothetical protein